jgi:glycosyltransferase involved in cell wall biosynthesis
MKDSLGTRRTGVVIPSFQASATLGAVLDGLLRFFPPDRVVVVDDGSTDGTHAIPASRGIPSLRHPANRGKGAALMSGLTEARRRGWEWAITLDADGQHTPEDLENFLSAEPGPRAGILLGCRARGGTAMPWHRRLSNALSTWIVSRLAGRPVFDAQCGFRAYRTDLTEALPGEGRFEWEAQALILCCRSGREIEKVPVRTVYTGGGSHIRLGRDTWRFLRMAGRLAWTR